MTAVNRVWHVRQRPAGAIGNQVLSLDQQAVPVRQDREFRFRINCRALDARKKLYTGGNTGKRLLRVAAPCEGHDLPALFSCTAGTT